MNCPGYAKAIKLKWRPDVAAKFKSRETNTNTNPSLRNGRDGGGPNEQIEEQIPATASASAGTDGDEGIYMFFGSVGEGEAISSDVSSSLSRASSTPSTPLQFPQKLPSTESILTLQHQPTNLISYYLTYVSKVCSIFDSDLNPFKRTLMSILADSEPLYHLTLGMSACHITHNHKDPALRVMALSLRNDGINSTRTTICNSKRTQVADGLILSVLLLGMTTAWYSMHDIGSAHIHGARILFKQWLQGPAESPHTAFILSSLVYWQTMFAFVGDDPVGNMLYHISLDKPIKAYNTSAFRYDSESKIRIMPLSGVSLGLFNAMGKVAAFSRATHMGITIPDPLAHAEKMESYLLQWRAPPLADIQQMHDAQTTSVHIIQLANAIRLSAILQLYSTIPGLLQRRMPKNSEFWTGDVYINYYDDINKNHPNIFTDAKDSGKEDMQDCQKIFLRGLAIHILEIIHGIPSSSGTATVQHLPLAIAAAWIAHFSPLPNPTNTSSHDMDDTTIKYWRGFIRMRLKSCSSYCGNIIPAKRIQFLMDELWRRNGSSGVQYDWIKLMTKDEYRTIFA